MTVVSVSCLQSCIQTSCVLQCMSLLVIVMAVTRVHALCHSVIHPFWFAASPAEPCGGNGQRENLPSSFKGLNAACGRKSTQNSISLNLSLSALVNSGCTITNNYRVNLHLLLLKLFFVFHGTF